MNGWNGHDAEATVAMMPLFKREKKKVKCGNEVTLFTTHTHRTIDK